MSEEKLSTVGKPVQKIDGVELVTGRAKFTADIKIPGTLFAYARRAGVAAGKLKNVDIRPAMKTDGVVTVLLSKDLPGPNIIGILPPFDQPLLAMDEIRYGGESVALVVGETKKAAKAGAMALKVDIEPLEPVLEIEEALEKGARKIHPDGNITFSKKLFIR